MRFAFIIVALSIGCGARPSTADPPSDGQAWVDPAADDDWSHLIDEAAGSEPLSIDEMESALNEALALGIPNAGEIFSRYYALLALGDEECPGSALAGGFGVFGSCTAESGVVFSGVSSLDVVDGRVYEDGEWVSGEYFIRTSPADYVITRTDGTALEAGGFIQFRRSSEGMDHRWTGGIEGSWRDSGAEGWLGQGISSGVLIQGGSRDGAPLFLELDGAYTVGSASLSFDRLSVHPGDCPDGFDQGSVAFRDGGGSLVTVAFSPCSVCGPGVLSDGTELGEICVDPAPLMAAVLPSGAFE
jgi:hypothetical protein